MPWVGLVSVTEPPGTPFSPTSHPQKKQMERLGLNKILNMQHTEKCADRNPRYPPRKVQLQ